MCSVSNYHKCLGNGSDLLGEKLLIRVRSYLKYLMRKERRRYLDNKPKLSFSKVILVVTLVCRTFSSLDEPHLMCPNQDTLLAHTSQDSCLQSILLCFLHLQMFGSSKYLWREVALKQKSACIKHIFYEQTGKINGCTSWFAFLKILVSWKMLPGKVNFVK